jgi:hypothetical protein
VHLKKEELQRAVHLKKEELQRVEVLKGNIMKKRGINNLDMESLLELIYLRILGRVKTRGQSRATSRS